MSGIGVIIGAFIVKYFLLYGLLLGFATGFFITGFAMIINDILDINIDRINRPERPLASGRLELRSARYAALMMLTLGVLAAAALGAVELFIAALFALLSFFYNWRLKRLGLLGNASVAASMSIPFVFGSLIKPELNSLIISLALTAFFAGVGREVIKGISDMKGDEKMGVRTIAVTRGSRQAAVVSSGFIIAAVITSYIPLLLDTRWWFPYGAGITVVDLLFLVEIGSILKDGSGTNAYKVKNRILFLMLAALVVYIIQGLI
ncbi:MAG: UbiA family prenyltransferase [Nitrososphaerota archaeon]|jgi:geranylgeranylglycerol-phosphate geranylgeranyltransferase|nr:UbiA family prenyltransferase [Nitrososphaerota archaeon]MDG6927571.1 UbiA family prenyltransferase [Nitrososphaerota archaeon]MDG6930655.1 UbiA family prenyltransferase [Nitrososphaerota archaeon]MDG6932490.1 UbiA family prenyltransferase [Nitrososphaerota archaeon]MDG6936229.1 UbiA family prenyltransferase [Nitrososphaerota archaeon]